MREIFNLRADSELDGHLRRACRAIEGSSSVWKHSVMWILRYRTFRLRDLADGVNGINPLGPLWPLIWIDRGYLSRASDERIVRTLLHESLHQCFVVWPEWKLWLNWAALKLLPGRKWRDTRFPLIPYSSIYGVGVNSADNIVAELLNS